MYINQNQMSTSFLHTFIVIYQDQNIRLDKLLALKLQDLSRSRLQFLIKNGFVTIDHIILQDPSLKVKEGQLIEVIIPPLVEAVPSPQNIPLIIHYEDNDVIVIDKSAGMVVHPAPGNLEGTLVNALLSHCGESLSGINGVKRPGIVHRLDKETSGLLVVAKHDKAHHFLAHQLETREMGRVYIALVWGMLSTQKGTLEGYIGRDPHNRQRMAMRQTGKFARTHYKVLKIFGRTASLIECRLETGRTHQIRVQLAENGHPLIGDILYGKPPKAVPLILKTFLSENWSRGRQSLHAKELSFIHPTTQKKLHFSVELPKDIRDLIDVLNLL